MPAQLGDFADRPEVQAILQAQISAPEAVFRLAEIGVSTSKSAVNRWRARRTDSAPSEPARTRVSAWTVGSSFDYVRGEGEFTTAPAGQYDDVDDAALLAEFGFDPDLFEVTAARRSLWQQREDGPWLEAKRVSVRRRQPLPGAIDFDAVEDILARYPSRPESSASGSALCVIVSDTQAGKINFSNNGGTPELVERFHRVITEVEERILTEFDGHLGQLVLCLGGDLVEHCTSQNGKLPLDADVTASIRLMRRLIVHAIGILAPLSDRVLVMSAPGNHGRVKSDPAGLKPTDNWDLECAIGAEDMLAMDPDKFGHVEFAYPDEGEPWVVRDVGTAGHPYVLALVHGDQARPEKLPDWLDKMAGGRQQPGEATGVISGHYHGFICRSLNGHRWWVQAPAMDSGSDWYRHKTGADVPSGIVSMELVIAERSFRGLTVHTGAGR
jgi:hypothetical protein